MTCRGCELRLWRSSCVLHAAHLHVFVPSRVTITASNTSTAISWRPTDTPADDLVPISTHISAASSAGWTSDPIFSPYYHETGYVTAASTTEGLAFVEEREIVGDKSDYTYLEGTEFRRTMREGVLTGDFPNWKGYWKQSGGGWVHARKAYVSACEEAERLGATFLSGDEVGRVTELLYDDAGGDIIGARTADGKEHLADRTICLLYTSPSPRD